MQQNTCRWISFAKSTDMCKQHYNQYTEHYHPTNIPHDIYSQSRLLLFPDPAAAHLLSVTID